MNTITISESEYWTLLANRRQLHGILCEYGTISSKERDRVYVEIQTKIDAMNEVGIKEWEKSLDID